MINADRPEYPRIKFRNGDSTKRPRRAAVGRKPAAARQNYAEVLVCLYKIHATGLTQSATGLAQSIPNYLPRWQGTKVLRAWAIAWASIGCLLCNCTLAAEVSTPQTSAQVHPQPQITHQLDGLPFGRLFSTPAQRLQWDRTRRQSGSTYQPAQEPSKTAGGGKGQGQPMRLSGVIMRDDGQQTLWLNGQIHHQSVAAPERAVLGDRQQSQTLRVRMGEKGRALKPGQVLQPGRPVQEAYQNPIPRPAAVEAVVVPLAEPVNKPAEPAKSTPLQAKPAETGPAPITEDKPPGR